MIDTKTNIELLHISSNLIDIFRDQNDMPVGDFQGCIEAQVISAYYIGRNELKNKILYELSDYKDEIAGGRIDNDELARNIIDLLGEQK